MGRKEKIGDRKKCPNCRRIIEYRKKGCCNKYWIHTDTGLVSCTIPKRK